MLFATIGMGRGFDLPPVIIEKLAFNRAGNPIPPNKASLL
jgi:hypothetical protein